MSGFEVLGGTCAAYFSVFGLRFFFGMGRSCSRFSRYKDKEAFRGIFRP